MTVWPQQFPRRQLPIFYASILAFQTHPISGDGPKADCDLQYIKHSTKKQKERTNDIPLAIDGANSKQTKNK